MTSQVGKWESEQVRMEELPTRDRFSLSHFQSG
jgi:hypothetical protein